MKIGFVLDDGLDKPDGVQQYIRTIGKWYQEQGHDVRYLVGETKRTDIEHVHSLAKNIRVRFNGNALTIPLPTSRKVIKRVLESEKFDVLHVQVPYSPFLGARVVMAASPQTTVVGTFHILPYDVLSRVGTRLLGMYLWRSLRRFNAFVSVSPPAAEFAAKTFKIKSVVIPNAVTMDVFRNKKSVAPHNELRIMFLNRLVPRKGCQQLLESLAILKKSNKLPENTVVDICSDGSMRQQLEKFVSQNNLSSYVTFHGFISKEKKVELMQNADIAVFPSLSGESFGIVLIEAMAAGSQVVLGGDNPGYRSVLEEIPGSIVDAHNPSVMADQLHEIISSPEKRKEMHKKQQQHVQQFDVPVVGQKLLDLYESCKTTHSG